jgi:Soluble lytic murein transglycosylase and related regulatory proteins (some contain LysM/invasin domains)
MIRTNIALGIAALTVIIAGVAGIGVEARSETNGPVPGAAPAIAPVVSVAPAVVMARRPSLAQILDLVLEDRKPESPLLPNGEFAPGSEEARIAGILDKYSSDQARVNRIAAAVVKEGHRRNIGSALLVGVLLTENPMLNPTARSSVGAIGLMQVMPFHAGKWGCASGNLFDIEANICHGVAILADNLKSARTLPSALLGYNGCVHGTNTPDCWRYASTVYRLARKGAEAGHGITPFSSQSTAIVRTARAMRLSSRPVSVVSPRGPQAN